MHRVLQQKWINGKACLVEDGELEALLDILNLSSDDIGEQREAEQVSDRNQEVYLADNMLAEDPEGGLPEILVDEQSGETTEKEEEPVDLAAETVAAEEATQEADETTDKTGEAEALEQPQYEDGFQEEPDQVVTWYYWPNGALMKG